MAHLIMGTRFAHRHQPAWHNISKKVWGDTERITAREAMVEVAGDIEFARSPLYYELDGTRHDAKLSAIVRKPTHDDPKWKVLGTVTEQWHIDTFPELAEALDDLVNHGYPIETAGILDDGGIAFLCFRGENYAVRGDEMRNYFTANFSLTPGIGHKVLESDVRTVCWNTNTMADRNAVINLSIPHSKDAKARITLAGKLVSQFSEMKDKAKAMFEAFADLQVTSKQVDDIIYAAFQLPELPSKLKMLKQNLNEYEQGIFRTALTADLLDSLTKAQEQYDRQCETANRLREVARERFEAFDPPRLRGTAWAAYNAVTEVADWREGRGADASAVTGSRAKEKSRAFEAAMALVAAK